MNEQYRAFISYSRANKVFALKLAKELRAKGFLIWLDQLDIPLGERWDREVERALKECAIFILIMTPDSIKSENVLDEIGYAIDHHKHFIPILLENCEIPFRLRRFQYLDFTNKNFEDGMGDTEELLRTLIDNISDLPAGLPQDQVAKKKTEHPSIKDAEKARLDLNREDYPEEEVIQDPAPTLYIRPSGDLPDTAVSKPRPALPNASYQSSSNSLPAIIPPSSASIPSEKQAAGLGSFGLIGVVFLIMICIIAGVVFGRIMQAGLFTSPSAPTGTAVMDTNMLMPAGASSDAAEATMPAGTNSPLYVRIKRITVDQAGNYVVDFEISGYNSQVPGIHMHFFFDTVSVDQAGSPGLGPWYLYTGKSPFTKYREIDRPDDATQMCVLVANHDHSVIPDTGNCKNLP